MMATRPSLTLQLTKEQLEQVENGWGVLNRRDDGSPGGPNGKVGVKELQRVYGHLGENHTEDEFRGFIRVLDRTGDGFINHEEFLAHMTRELGKSTEKEREEGLRRGFAALDKEQTGKIPMDMFKRRLRESVRLTEAEAQQVAKAVNVNGVATFVID